jgi:hypothetical protein
VTRLLALAFLATVLLGGCADEANDVTCGEFAGMSTDQRRIVVRDLAQENDTEAELAELGEGDRGVDLASLGIAERCAGAEDDATISEVFAPDAPTPATPTG